MAFNHACKLCPMKFISKTDLQLHLPVHSNTTDCGFENDTGHLFREFLQSFFPNLNSSDIPCLSPNSLPAQPDEAEQPLPEDVKTYTTLLNMKVPGYDPIADSLHLGDPIGDSFHLGDPIGDSFNLGDPIANSIVLKKLPTTIRFVRPLRYAIDLRTEPVIQPIYIESPNPSVALIRPGEDRWTRARPPNILRPTVVSRVVPTITRVRRHIPIEKPQYAFETLKEDRNGSAAPPPVKKRLDRSMVGIELYSCEVCSKRFATLQNLISHKHTVHAVGKLHSCFLCHKRFAFSYKLNRHLLQHNRETPLKSHLKRHRMKGGRLAYSCDVCNRRFGRINYLNLHRKCHEGRETVDKGCDSELIG